MEEKKIFAIINKKYNIRKITLLNNTNNKIYLLEINNKKWVLKIFNDSTTNFLLEKKVFEKLKERKYLFYNSNFSIYEYLEGVALDQEIYKSIDEENVINQILDIINKINNVKSVGSGKLNNSFLGKSCSWSDFITSYMYSQMNKAKNIPATIKKIVFNNLDNNSYLINSCIEKTIPMDLNLKNFIINKEKEIKIINIPVIWRGDIYAPYGEFATHIYKTKLWKPYINIIYNKNLNVKIIYFYMLMMAFTILTYVTNFTNVRYVDATPWGNSKTTLLNIIKESNKFLNI